MQRYITTSYIPLNRTEGILGETYPILRRQHNQYDRDRLQEERSPLPFRGDEEEDGPPLAWTLIWGGTYSNLYGYYIPEGMSHWGYVFWDAVRLERTGAKHLLKRQWDDYWDGDDPRDDL